MRRQGLRSKVARKFRVTTDSNHNLAAAPNLLDRNFDIDTPNTVWASDITYLQSKAGWLYLTVFIDLFSRRIVGWYVEATACITRWSSRRSGVLSKPGVRQRGW